MKLSGCLIVSIAMLFVTLLSGCAADGADLEVITVSVKYKASEVREPLAYSAFGLRGLGGNVMPYGGYVAPHNAVSDYLGNKMPPMIRQEVFDDIAEAGVNYMIGIHDNYIKGDTDGNAAKILEMSGNAGILTMLPVRDLLNVALTDQKLAPAVDWTETLEELLEYPSFGGIYGKDEPSMALFGQMADANEVFGLVQENMKGAADDLLLYWNMLPLQATSAQLTGSATAAITYDEYVDGFLAAKPQFLMYDQYPFSGVEGTIHSTWFTNMSTVRKKADENNLAWWAFTQTGGLWNSNVSAPRIPTEGEFLWDLNTMLAYGAKGIAHFPLCYPSGYMKVRVQNDALDFSNHSLIDPYGSKNPSWYYSKKAAVQVQAVDEYLMRAKNVGVIVNGASRAPIPSDDILGDGWRELKKVAGDPALIGCFDYQGKTALYIVGDPYKDVSEITLEFTDRYGYDVIQRGERVSVAATKLPLKLAAGEGALVVLK
ncbi:hypothetical protein FACS1894211_00220 [Clostridia bacterium]|nr:hypothetical protein FACS1894211_00220 [Clostridia bacterium]